METSNPGDGPMKKTLFLINLIVIVLIFLAGCQVEPAALATSTVAYSARQSSITQDNDATANLSSLNNSVEPSCADPTADIASRCEAMDQKILAATVRLELHGPNGGIGHGTIKDGRYLVTHNHYAVSGAVLANSGENGVTAVSVLKANGDIILLEAPLTFFTVALDAPEILVLDFKEYGGIGFFDSVGVPSAEFKAWNSLSLQPGMEVAQIDWDGSTAFVKWVKINNVTIVAGGTPTLELANFVAHGASGGGVFWNGYHIANNWNRVTESNQDNGAVLRQYSVAVLDSSPIVAAVAAPVLH
jgi:hypothetical protein